MKRGYTVARYEELLAKIRARIPGVSVTSDVIVGFPGETDAIFETCMEAYARIRFDQQFMFVYSPRPGTPAATLPDQVPQGVKVARMQRLVDLQNTISTEINTAAAGQTFEVMAEGPSARDAARGAGRARNDKAMVFTAARLPERGELVQVVAEQGHLWGCSGQMVE
jgi:tRNA-2-methylthio-N6-dimethylallyladenosine synthase